MALLSSYTNNKVYLESGIIALFLKNQENNMDNKLLFFCIHTILCLPYCRAQNNIVNFSNYCIFI